MDRHPNPVTQVRGKWFLLGCGLELLLLGVAAGLAWALDTPLLGGAPQGFAGFARGSESLGEKPDLLADLLGALLAGGAGLVATAPLLLLFWWGLRSRYPPAVGIRRTLDTLAFPLLGQWSIAQLVVISILAGICEEILFRAVIQGGLVEPVGTLAALLLASIAFGLAHLMTLAYAIAAALIGLYLGGLWILTGNLLAPVVTHAVYDAVVLIYLVRVHWPARLGTG